MWHSAKFIAVQRKAKRLDGEILDWKIRSHANGFVFVHLDTWDGRMGGLAVDAVAALGLDFGAVDIIWNEKQDKFYVLEVNTAPGLEGKTVTAYVNAFKEHFDA